MKTNRRPPRRDRTDARLDGIHHVTPQHTHAPSPPSLPPCTLALCTPAESLRQDLTSDMDLSPQLHSQAHQLVSESKGSAHSSRKH